MPRFLRPRRKAMPCALALMLAAAPLSAQPQISPFAQTVAIAAAKDDALSAFYAKRNYQPIWTAADSAERRAILLGALSRAADHGLPAQRYDARALAEALRAARTEGDRARIEVRMTRALLDYAHDLHSGVLEPKKIDSTIVRTLPRLEDAQVLTVAEAGDLAGFLGSLAPTAPAYAQLIKAKIGIERQIARGGWGAELTSRPKPGSSGDAVVALRDRLVAMGYLSLSASRDYDAEIQRAVQRFQLAHGLNADGIVDESTLTEMNVPPEQRLKSVLVALERERWMNIERGRRHIWVNQTDFTARIIDDGKETFVTRAVIGKNVPDQRTPEFSDEMEYMVVNPSWSVPRSITTKEYLPLLKKNPNAAGHLKIVDSRGRVVDRGSINFGKYTAANFPFAMRQPPSDGNALGLVKFMFPNQWNIYLHDTPSKSLFQREVRAFSHGCVRLGDPFDFAYALLGAQSDDPVGLFQGVLKSGREQAIKLEQHVPVHLVYFTAFPGPKGEMNYRRDIYGRDAAIYQALIAAGVAPGGQQG
ncbi:L,D-transpeptidase family protein [Gemmobacter sp. LW-1]|uniref:L,D-transpeptidase family protein n=1 Tax=Gemmobacter sp. LW-1 TaxID=1529005 RepID=UPI0009EAF8DE